MNAMRFVVTRFRIIEPKIRGLARPKTQQMLKSDSEQRQLGNSMALIQFTGILMPLSSITRSLPAAIIRERNFL